MKRIQDKLKSSSLVSSLNLYVGYKWYACVKYDSDFASYACVATGYYIHTYSNAEITNISFGVSGKTGGVNIVIENSSKSFVAYSSDLKIE